MDATYSVKGMTCGGCARSVTNALKHSAPSLEVEVSVERGTVRVRGDIEDDAVRAAVDAAGFEFGGRLPAAPAAPGSGSA